MILAINCFSDLPKGRTPDLVDLVSDGEVGGAVLLEPAPVFLHQRHHDGAAAVLVVLVHVAHVDMVLRVRVVRCCTRNTSRWLNFS